MSQKCRTRPYKKYAMGNTICVIGIAATQRAAVAHCVISMCNNWGSCLYDCEMVAHPAGTPQHTRIGTELLVHYSTLLAHSSSLLVPYA